MTNSIWSSFSNDTNFPHLSQDLNVDVAIIGGGITGITAAQLLSEKGMRVAVLEKACIGKSSTGNSTGNLYEAVAEILLYVRKKFGDDVMEMVVDSRREAIDLIGQNVSNFGIDCDFIRTNWNYYTTVPGAAKKIKDAHDAAKKIGMKVEYSNLEESGFKVKKGIRMEGAAQLNPLRYVQGLAKAINPSDNCLIFENTEVVTIHDSTDGIKLVTKNGQTIQAKYLIHATHSPKGIMLFHAEMGPYREYGIAAKIRGKHPPGVYFGYYAPTDIHSTRLYERDGEQFLVCVGEPHKVGHGDNLEYMNRLEKFARDHFDVIEVTHRWGAQNYKAPDYLPYIGPKSEGSNVYVATGMSSHGLTYGTVAAQIISDQIIGVDNAYSEIYRPYRFNPMKSAPKLIKENVDVVLSFVKDYLLKKNKTTFADVKPGEGKVIEEEGHKLAVFRNENEGLQICSAVCTHMGCIVHWNNAEQSWDCPCHGSRFDTHGEVLEGPAFKALTSLSELLGHEDLIEEYGRLNQQHLMTQDEMIDEAGFESFPASDPPGHFSKSILDKDQHSQP